MGYRPDPPAKLLRGHHSQTPGVVFDPGDPFHAGLLQAIYPAAGRCGYEIVLGARVPDRSERRAVEGPIAARCGDRPRPKQAIWRALSARLSVAVLGRRGGDADVDGVRTAGNSEAQGRRGPARRPG